MDAFSTKRNNKQQQQQHYSKRTGDFSNSPASYSKQTQRKRNILSKQEVFRMLAPQLDPLPRRIGRHQLASAWMLLESPIVLLISTNSKVSNYNHNRNNNNNNTNRYSSKPPSSSSRIYNRMVEPRAAIHGMA